MSKEETETKSIRKVRKKKKGDFFFALYALSFFFFFFLLLFLSQLPHPSEPGRGIALRVVPVGVGPRAPLGLVEHDDRFPLGLEGRDRRR